jgi:hypothetical protein
MIVALALLLAADEPRQLKYVFKAGDEAKYVNTQTRTTAYTKAGKKFEVSLEQKSANLSKVLKVSPEGNAEIGQTITRLRVSHKGGPLGVQMIDSANDDNPEPIQGLFNDLTKAEIRFKMAPNGDVSDVTIPETLKARLKPKKEGETSLLTEQAIVGMVKGSAFILPKKPLAVGDGWDVGPFTYQESGHWITVTTRITFEGPIEQEGRKLLKFTRNPEYTLRRPTDAKTDPETTIKRQSGEGSLLLDAATCQLVEGTMAETLVTETGSGTDRVEVQTTINTTIRLRKPDKEQAETTTP